MSPQENTIVPLNELITILNNISPPCLTNDKQEQLQRIVSTMNGLYDQRNGIVALSAVDFIMLIDYYSYIKEHCVEIRYDDYNSNGVLFCKNCGE